ncbi:MAG TPA: hypothetical protein VFX16_11545 [Pseudonocardiaceae bacterium]|nr:hypothetical protein [Pseudonocardiaceae bacterium]
MEPVTKQTLRRDPREFTPGFKTEIIGLRRRGDRTVAQVVADFDLDAGVRTDGLSSTEKAELTALRAENRRPILGSPRRTQLRP